MKSFVDHLLTFTLIFAVIDNDEPEMGFGVVDSLIIY
jgi:hypothetical protein